MQNNKKSKINFFTSLNFTSKSSELFHKSENTEILVAGLTL